MIRESCADGVHTLTLDRPEKANALTRDMLDALDAAVQRADRDAARALVLTGAGNVFSAGADLDAARAGLATDPVWERLSARIAALPCLTIAALNGSAAGGALGMVLACDLRVGVAGLRMFYPVMRLGFLPQPSDPARLTVLVGPARAKLMLMTGAKVGAEEALAWGLLDRLCEAEALEHDIAELVADVRSASPQHVAAIKGMCRA